MKFNQGELEICAAPMEGYTDLTFIKLIYELAPPDFLFTAFFRVTRNFNAKHFVKQLAPYIPVPFLDRLVVQIMGNDPLSVSEAAYIAQQEGIKWVDINLGCPSRTVMAHHAGASLLAQPDLLIKILDTTRQRIDIRFSAKIRLGIENPDGFPFLLKKLDTIGLDRIIIHARTVKDGYVHPARLASIAEATAICQTPIIGNGDLYSIQDCLTLQQKSNCVGAMIGRGLLENPWVFQQVTSAPNGLGRRQLAVADVQDFMERVKTAYTESESPSLRLLSRLKAFYVPVMKPLQGRVDRACYLRVIRSLTVDQFFAHLDQLR